MHKLLSIGNFCNPSWDGSLPDEEHIARGFEALHWKVGRFQREETQLDEWPEFTPDIILIAQWHGYPEHIANKLREHYGVPVVYWAFDYQWDSNEAWHFELASEANLFLSKELDHKGDYESRYRSPFHWFSQDFAPQFLDKHPEPVAPIYDVLFTGTYLPQATFRNDLLLAIDKQFDLHVHSVTVKEFQALGLKHVHPPLLDFDLPKLYAQAKINLSCDWKQADGYWSDRLSQILSCGGFVLNKFVPMQEIAFPFPLAHFHTIDDCLELIGRYLPRDVDRADIAEIGYLYASQHLRVNWKVVELEMLLRGKGLIGG